jgi:hypothetical protein
VAQADAFGYRGWVGWGKESVWGTPVAAAEYQEIVSETIKKSIERNEAESTRSLSLKRRYEGLHMSGGDVVMEMAFEGHEKLWEQLFGADDVIATFGVAAQRHQFLMSPEAVPDVQTGLTMEVYRGDKSQLESGPEDTSWQYDGLLIPTATINIEPNVAPKVTWNVLGREETAIPKTTPTLIDLTGGLLLLDHKVDVQIATTSVSVDSVVITIDNGFDTGKRVVGSKYLDRPVRQNRRKITGTIVFDWLDKNLYNDFISDAAKQLDIVVTSVANMAGEATPYEFQLFIPTAHFEGETSGIDAPGILKQTINFTALAAGEGTSDLGYLELENLKATT